MAYFLYRFFVGFYWKIFISFIKMYFSFVIHIFTLTLVHTLFYKIKCIKNLKIFQFGLNIRPYCYEFLEKLAKLYEIFVFTASSPNYANAIVNFIDPQKILINGILTRENCLQTKNGFFIKDLRVINNRNLKNMIIVDNLSHSFGFQIENGVPILEFHNDRKDKELKFLQNYLIEAWECEDMREFNRKKLRLQELADMKIEDLNI